MVSLRITRFSAHKSYVLPTQCIYVFCMDLRTNTDYFSTQYQLTGFYYRDGECSQRGTDWILIYRMSTNYRRILLRHNLSRKCGKIVKFLSITHSERNIWNCPIVATAISRENRKPVLDGNFYLTDRA
jgi:hypothetical protein